MPPQPDILHTLFPASRLLCCSRNATFGLVSLRDSHFDQGGRPCSSGNKDVQLGVNKSASRTLKSLAACAGGYLQVLESTRRSSSNSQHSILTMAPNANPGGPSPLHEHARLSSGASSGSSKGTTPEGYSSNVLHDMLVAVGTQAPIWDMIKEVNCEKGIFWTDYPREAVKGADVVVTDTWISTGPESERARRLKDFKGFQVTEKLCKEGRAHPDRKFLHCLPRKEYEVGDEVLHGLDLSCSPKLETGSGPSWHCSINCLASGN